MVDDPVLARRPVIQVFEYEDARGGIDGQERGCHGSRRSGGEPQGGDLAGVPVVGLQAVDELLHHRRGARQLDPPHARAGAAAQPARVPRRSQLGP
ncbi:hypothetical protein [Streptomyces sp. Isolate_45]|uniref:hypothetical protein n=1 Tax=Streptomyces sp. Isolate_45 TaxID=2950111 RepID=UPI0032B27691